MGKRELVALVFPCLWFVAYVRLYPIHILPYLTTGKLLTDPETQNGDAHDHTK